MIDLYVGGVVLMVLLRRCLGGILRVVPSVCVTSLGVWVWKSPRTMMCVSGYLRSRIFVLVAYF